MKGSTASHRSFAKFHELPLSSIEPSGWLREFLELQRDGLTGYPESSRFPYDTRGWGGSPVAKTRGTHWWPYEQTGYWVDGAIRCAHLLGDRPLLRKALRQIDYVLRRPDKDGYLGPLHIKKAVDMNRWAHAVFFRALMAHHSATGNPRIISALRKHYLSDTSPHTHHREVCNVEALLWTYERTGDRRLLDRALKAWKGFNRSEPGRSSVTARAMLSRRKAHCHGVTYMEVAKLPAIIYMHTGDRNLLRASLNAFKKIDRNHMLVSGVPSSSEYLTGRSSLDSHETCDVADFTWAAGYLLMATGDPKYADAIERACLNAGPGSVKKDFRALQYFSCPNQVLATSISDHNPFQKGKNWMAFIPDHEVQCCPGNVHRFMPNYAARSWMATPGGGLAAVFYAPGKVSALVGRRRVPVTVETDTRYPFSGRVDLKIRAARTVRFPLLLRIPGWCRNAQVLLNGRRVKASPKPGTFLRLERTFSGSELVTVLLPMELKLNRRPQSGVSVEFGPLVYSLLISEEWRPARKSRGKKTRFPGWELKAGSRWNYALALKERDLTEAVKITMAPPSDFPWIGDAPIRLSIPARRVLGWKTEKRSAVVRGYPWANSRNEAWASPKKVAGRFEFTPPLPSPASLRGNLSKNIEMVTLVPYGATHLRITTFPFCR